MDFLCVLIALIGYCVIYAWFSIRVKSWVNVLTPKFLLAVPTLYLAELGYLNYAKNTGSILGYLIVYSTYFFMTLFYALGYLYLKPSKWIYSFNAHVEYKIAIPILIMMMAFVIYWPVMSEFADSLFDPRRIYIATRTGYGINYFLSITLAYISLVLVLFKKNLSSVIKAFFVVLVIFFAYLHGSKGQVITTLFITMMYFFVAQERRVGFRGFLGVGGFAALAGFMLFYIMLNSVDFSEIALTISGYSDYSRNAVMLIDKSEPIHFGRLLIEDNFYSRIPRAIFLDKPKDFGGFELAKKYFPDEFYRDEGVPSFGIGMFFADFSAFGMLFLSVFSAIGGYLTRSIIFRLKKNNNPSDFILLLFFSGIVLLPIGAGFLLPEHVLLAVVVYFICKIGSIRIFR